MKIISLLKTPIAVLALTVLTSSCTSYREPTDEQIKDALQPFGGKVTVFISKDVHDTGNSFKYVVYKIVEKGIAEAVFDIAALIENDPLGYIQLFPEQKAELAHIKKTLGREKRKEVKYAFGTSKPEVTWYRYGWLSFGDVDGAVEVIRIDHKEEE